MQYPDNLSGFGFWSSFIALLVVPVSLKWIGWFRVPWWFIILGWVCDLYIGLSTLRETNKVSEPSDSG
jgi:hypothetical protein